MARGKKKEKALSPEEKLAQALVVESEQPYQVPENWCWTSFASISLIRTGKKDANYGSKDGQYPFFTCAADPIRCDGYSFDCNAILLAGNGDINNISRYEGKFEAYQRTYVVEVSQPINTDLMYHYFKYRWFDYNKDKMFGTAIPYIRLGNLQTFPIPLAPLSEQQRIVDRIEGLFSKLDEAKEKAQAVLDSFETRKAAILHKAFTGELTAKWRAERSVGMDGWKECLLGDIFDMKAGKNISASKINSVKTEEMQYPCFGGNGVRGFVEAYNCEGEHPIIGRQGALCGNVNLAAGMFYATEHAVVVSYKLDVATTWAVHYLRFLNLNQYATATAQPGLAVSNILKLPATYIPYEEQQELSKIIDSIFTKEQRVKEAAEAALEQIDLLKKSILARAFRGELGTNDPTDEPAIELLKRIL